MHDDVGVDEQDVHAGGLIEGDPDAVEVVRMRLARVVGEEVHGEQRERLRRRGDALNQIAKLGLTEDELKEHVRSNLARYKVPREVVFLDELPRNPTGKVLKRELRAPYWEGRNRQV